MKILMFSLIICSASATMAQTKVVTTGNNVIDATNPFAADVVIGSDANGGIRHDSSIMWWSNNSASRISNTGNTFNFSVWATPQLPNVSLGSEMGGTSYLMGNVGIGTLNPDQKLTIKGGGIGFDNNSADKKLYSPLDGDLEWMTHTLAAGHGFAVSFQGEKRVYLNVAGNSYFNGGNVGIGTTSPTDMLTVAGKIGAREVKVSTNAGADFVFEPNYKLPDLTELEEFVKTNKHLPEIPTAKEMVENGVNLGELNIKLLQKVEELTLHLIDKDKALKNEKVINRKQQQQIDKVIRELAALKKTKKH